MGYMTVAMILNDAFTQLEKNKEQVINNINEATMMREGIGTFSIGNHANPMQVASSQHADVPQLLLAYQNDFTRFGYLNDLEEDRHLEYRKKRLEIAESVIKQEKRAIKEMEQRIEEEKKYEEVVLQVGTTIDEAVEKLKEYEQKGVKVFVAFNGHKLFAGKTTLNGAYRKIVGMSKEEFERKTKNEEV